MKKVSIALKQNQYLFLKIEQINQSGILIFKFDSIFKKTFIITIFIIDDDF